MMAKKFPPEVHAFIRDHVDGTTTRELAEMVNDRFGTDFNVGRMKSYKAKHKLTSGTPRSREKGAPTKLFPKEVQDYIRANHAGTGPMEMAERLNQTFGTSYTKVQIHGYYHNHGISSGLTGWFQPGHVSHNKGKKGFPSTEGMKRNQFRKGYLPHNTKPIGHERTTSEGYVQVKVRMRPSRKNCNDNYVFKHRLIWEAAHGKKLPEDMRIIFLDGDKHNLSPDNLAAVPKRARGIMARKGYYTQVPELTRAGITLAQIQLARSRKKRKEAGSHG